jgi:hypothetical protein
VNVSTLARRRPVPALATGAFVVALVVTVLYFAGLIPGVPKTLPTFVDLLVVTIGLFAVAVVAWVMSLTVR